MWSVYQRTIDGDQRTNNYAEGTNHSLKNDFGCSHPSIWTFIDKLRARQKNIDANYAQFVRGDDPPPKKKRLRDNDRRILNKVRAYVPINQNPPDHNYFPPPQFNPHTIIEFLTGISHNYDWTLEIFAPFQLFIRANLLLPVFLLITTWIADISCKCFQLFINADLFFITGIATLVCLIY